MTTLLLLLALAVADDAEALEKFKADIKGKDGAARATAVEELAKTKSSKICAKLASLLTGEVTEVKESGIDVKIIGTDLMAFIKRSELARDRGEQRPERFAVGEKVDARVTQFDRRSHKITVSIKALEVAEEKEAIAQYGSTDSGATLGDILGTAIKRATEKKE